MSEGEGKKRDVKSLVAIIPSASELKKEEKKQVEKRIRVRRREEVKPEQAFISPKLLEELRVEKEVEIIVAGKKKLRFKAVSSENVPEREVWCNSEVLRENGIADNSIATVRAFRG